MKIGFDAKRAFHNFRGLGNYSRNLVEGLKYYYPDNEYVLYTPEFSDSRAIDWHKKHPEFNIKKPENFILKKFSNLWRSNFLPREIKKDQIDLYHGLSHELPVGISKLNIKKVVTIHDLIAVKFPEMFPLIDGKVYNLKMKYSCNTADFIIAICEQTKRDIQEVYDISEHKIKVLYQSCNQRFYSIGSDKKQRDLKNKYNLPDSFFLYVGAFEHRKNLLNILEAFSQMRKKDDFFVFVGSGETQYYKKMQDIVRKLNLKDHVLFLNHISNEDIPIIYQQALCLVYPSFYEGFGIPVIESLFSQTPVITTNCSSLPEAGGDGALYLEDPDDAEELASLMQKIRDDESLRRLLSSRGRKYVERFHRHEVSKDLHNFYLSVINDKFVS